MDGVGTSHTCGDHMLLYTGCDLLEPNTHSSKVAYAGDLDFCAVGALEHPQTHATSSVLAGVAACCVETDRMLPAAAAQGALYNTDTLALMEK
ncbi:hypothetical protein H920_13197 [Fukomys damarensis]|uniref:Uncharacterized protein n=1 Tax=Fukomys damarensis TaxID=885580 RepID=A0A091DRJ4_FUKDA|nr:hypothetical protein H920_13197 [Fukomys damarensis]